MTWTGLIEFAPTKSPLDPPADGDWVELGEPFSISIDRGRQDDLDEFEPGLMTVVLDNSDESLDHLLASSDIYDTEALPFTPLRFSLVQGPEVRVIFSGYTIDGFAPDGLRGGGTVSVQVTDWLGWANSVKSPDCQWAAWVQRVAPTVWMRGYATRAHLEDPGVIAYNSAAIFRGAGGDMQADPAYPYLVTRTTTSLVTGASSPHFSMGDFTHNGGLIMDAGDSIAQSGQWLACAWFRTPDASSLWWAGSDWYVQIDASGYLYAFITVAGFGEAVTLSFDHTDDVEHVWFLKVTSTGGSRSMKLYSDMGSATHVIGAAGNSGGGILNFHGVGFTDAETGDFTYFDGTGNLPDVYAITNEDGLPPASWAGPIANPALWSGDTIQERMAHIIAASGVPAPSYQVLADTNTMDAFNPSGTLSADVRLLGASYLGAAYCTRDGKVRVRDSTFTSYAIPDFDQIKVVISDDPAATAPTSTITDAFTRANNADIGGDWLYDGDGLTGNLGIISNAAYVSSASSANPTIRYQQFASNCTVEVDFVNEVNKQGLVVRYDNPTGVALMANFISVEKDTATVNVYTWIAGTKTLLGTTGADALGTTLTVTVEDETLTVQIDGGTIHTFTITTAEHMNGDGVGLSYTNIGVLPANTARWDNFSADMTGIVVRATSRGRTPPRADRVLNMITGDSDSGDVYYQDADSIRRYGPREKSFTSNAGDLDALEDRIAAVLAARKDPTIEIGEIVLKPAVNEDVANWVVRDMELERPVTYREALYVAGTEVLDATYRLSGEKWDWQNGTDWTVTVKLVPA